MTHAQSVESTPEVLDPQLTDVPFSPSDPPLHLRGYPLYVWEHAPELRLRASKMSECGQNHRKYKDAANHVWSITHTCSAKTCYTCPEARAKELFEKYSVLESYVPAEFLYLQAEEHAAKKVRKALGKLKVPLLSNLGWLEGGDKAKMILLASPTSIPSKLLNKIRTLDYTIQIETHPREDFPFILKKVLAPELPARFEDRLRIEESKSRRLHFSGMKQAERAKLFAKESPSNADNFTSSGGEVSDVAPQEKVCRCPKCGKPAISHTQVMPIGTPLSQERWTTPSPPG